MLSVESARPAGASGTIYLWVNHGLEFLWLLTVVLVPIAYLDRDYVLSEAVIGYLEVPRSPCCARQ